MHRRIRYLRAETIKFLRVKFGATATTCWRPETFNASQRRLCNSHTQWALFPQIVAEGRAAVQNKLFGGDAIISAMYISECTACGVSPTYYNQCL